jgi:hypothetical protein
MTRCYLCQDIGTYSTEPCPNEPPCKPQDICGFQVVRCEHKEAARVDELIESAWQIDRYHVGIDLVGGSYEDWEYLSEKAQDVVLGDRRAIYRMGYLAGLEQGKTERR